MAPRQGSSGNSEEDEDHQTVPSSGGRQHANFLHGEEGDASDAGDSEFEGPPSHPMAAMQDAFEESIFESAEEERRPESSIADRDAEARRQKLLQTKHYDDSWTTRWKQRPGARYHPLLKLMAQIVFGMHLLHQQQAKSDEEVVKILQNHVDDVDGFLEKTTEDFNLAISDIEERLRNLKLPMTHIDVFDIMLDDKRFRTELVDGNDKIEKIIDRTARAMDAALEDVQKGMEANQLLGRYLDSVRDQWPKDKQDLRSIYVAMCGNEQGWVKALKGLQAKGDNLGDLLRQLSSTIGELSRLAAAASRRNKAQSQAVTTNGDGQYTTSLQSKYSNETPRNKISLDKPLPKEPNVAAGASRAPSSKAHPIPYAERFETPRQQPQPPISPRSVKATETRRITQDPLSRPKTAGVMAPREPQSNPKSETSELAEFLRSSGPLRQNPPELTVNPQNHPDTENNPPTAHNAPGPTHRKPLRSRRPSPPTPQQHIQPIPPPKSTARPTNPAHLIQNEIQHRTTAAAVARPSTPPGTAMTALPSLGDRSPNRAREQAPLKTGFARRVDCRKKFLPPLDYTPDGEEKVGAKRSPAVDSVHETTSAADGVGSGKVEGAGDSGSSSGGMQRSGSRLGLFPAVGGDGGEGGRGGTESREGGPEMGKTETSTASESAIPARSGTKSRGRGFRGFFSRRGRRETMA